MNISPIPVHGAFCPKSLINTRKVHQKRRLKTGTFSASLISNTKLNLVIPSWRCDMNDVKPVVQPKPTLKAFLVQLLSVRAGVYIKQNNQPPKTKG